MVRYTAGTVGGEGRRAGGTGLLGATPPQLARPGAPGACAVLVLGGCMTALVFSVKRDVKPPAKRAGE